MIHGTKIEDPAPRRLVELAPAVIVLLLSLGITYAGWSYEIKRTEEAANVRFTQASKSVQNDIVATMLAYAQFLRGGVGLFHASENVTRDDWRRYVADLAFAETYPGIQGISFNAVIRSDVERAEYQNKIRATGDPDYTIRPETEHPISVPIVYLEPMTPRNVPAIGFDIYSESRRRAAIDRAMNTGQISMTAKITLVQENDQDVQAGVLLMLPVYRDSMTPASPDERFEETSGLIVSVFRIGNLMRHIMKRHTSDFANEIAFVLSDGTDSSPESLLFKSHPDIDAANVAPTHQYDSQLDIFGQSWKLTAFSTATYEARVSQSSPAIVLGLGIVVSFLLTALVWAQGLRVRAGEAAARAARRNERHVQLLLHEVNHRAKNMLSVISAIARQTSAKNPEDFSETFADRIESLGASHDLLVENAWKGILLSRLVTSQLAHFGSVLGKRITMDGPSVQLNATAAQNIGMALHELGTNAGKYGALSQDTGKIAIQWKVTFDDKGVQLLSLSWEETDGPVVTPPDGNGFGTVVLGAMIRSNLSAQVDMEYNPQGIVWRMTCPLSACIEPDEDL